MTLKVNNQLHLAIDNFNIYISSLRIDIIFVQQFFTTSDFTNLVKRITFSPQYFDLIPDFGNIKSFYIQKNEYSLDDDWIGIRSPKKGEFFEIVEDQFNYYKSEHDQIDLIFLSSHNLVKQHFRSVPTILDIIGKIGGIFELGELLLHIVITFYSKILFSIAIKKTLNNQRKGKVSSQQDVAKEDKIEFDNL